MLHILHTTAYDDTASMVPKKLWLLLKIVVLLGIFLLAQTIISRVFSYVDLVREQTEIGYYPIASLYRTGVDPIITHQCRNHVTIYNHMLIEFVNITLDPTKAHANAKGGAILKDTVTQPESAEMFDITKGFLTLPCKDNDLNLNSRVLQDLDYYIQQWRDSITVINDNSNVTSQTQKGLTIIVERNEYANVYWTIMDLYDVFITMRYLNHTLRDTSIILADARPKGHLDALWNSFISVTRLQDIKVPILIDQLAWRFDRDSSPLLSHDLRQVPLIEDFRQFVIHTQHILVKPSKATTPKLCSHLRILFIWRHDYVAHPRNPQGIISRKISNEDEILNATREAYPMHKITAVQLDNYDVTEQLNLITNTDVMIGMHGAAMAYSVMQPRDGAVVELFPSYYGFPNWHMKKLAKWSHHGYFRYILDPDLDDIDAQSTSVPSDVVIKAISKASQFVCERRGRQTNVTQHKA